jgi:hypothetical protein
VDYCERFNETSRHQEGSLCTRTWDEPVFYFGCHSPRMGSDFLFSLTVRISSAKHEVIMVGERAGRGLYLLKIHPRFFHEDHDKQLGFTPPIKTGFQDYQVNFAFASSISPGLSTWHRRLAHVNYRTIIKMASSGVVDGLDLANNTIYKTPCAGCAYGKHQRSPFPTGRTRATYTGQLIHSDLFCGPMEKLTPNGCLYFVLFIDDSSGFRFIFFLKAKSEAADHFKNLISIIRGKT